MLKHQPCMAKIGVANPIFPISWVKLLCRWISLRALSSFFDFWNSLFIAALNRLQATFSAHSKDFRILQEVGARNHVVGFIEAEVGQ